MSDFLKKLTESLTAGKPNEAIKAGFDEILAKAEKLDNPESLKAIEEKAAKITEQIGVENSKKMTLEEVKKLNELAKAEEDRMLQTEQKALVTSGVIALNCEIEQIEQEIEERKLLIETYTERTKFLQGDASYKEKKELIDKSIEEFNNRK